MIKLLFRLILRNYFHESFWQPDPRANAGRDTTGCFGKPVQLNGSGGAVYLWSFATYLSSSTAANPVASLSVAGSYSYIINLKLVAPGRVK